MNYYDRKKIKFKKQLYIFQRFLERSNTWTFQVQIRKKDLKILKNFREKEYGSARNAYDNAISFRDKTLNEIINGNYLEKNNKSVEYCYDLSYELYPVLYNTRKKNNIYFNNFEAYKIKIFKS